VSSTVLDIANILTSSAIDIGEIGVTLFLGQEPTTPDNVFTLYSTGGFAPDAKYSYDRPTMMVRVRDFDYETGFALAKSIKDALHGLNNITEGGTRYIGIWAMNDVNSLGKDDNNRFIFTVNFRIHKTTS
jgi:hypothetical protein